MAVVWVDERWQARRVTEHSSTQHLSCRSQRESCCSAQSTYVIIFRNLVETFVNCSRIAWPRSVHTDPLPMNDHIWSTTCSYAHFPSPDLRPRSALIKQSIKKYMSGTDTWISLRSAAATLTPQQAANQLFCSCSCDQSASVCGSTPALLTKVWVWPVREIVEVHIALHKAVYEHVLAELRLLLERLVVLLLLSRRCGETSSAHMWLVFRPRWLCLDSASNALLPKCDHDG